MRTDTENFAPCPLKDASNGSQTLKIILIKFFAVYLFGAEMNVLHQSACADPPYPAAVTDSIKEEWETTGCNCIVYL